MKRVLLVAALVCSSLGSALAAVKGQEVEYKAGDTTLKGYLAYDDSIKGKRPGVLVVHEWWGHNEYARKRARMLAELGYTALAVDMYGEGRQAAHPDDAGKFAGELRKNMPLARARFNAAHDLLKQHPTVTANQTAAIGYCFGGGVVLEMARAGADLDGVVSFHGSLNTDNPAQPGKVQAQVLVFNGADDPFVKQEQIEQFKQEMEAANVQYRFVSLPNAKHSFTNPQADEFGEKFNLPLEYNAQADQTSWKQMQTFLDSLFKQ